MLRFLTSIWLAPSLVLADTASVPANALEADSENICGYDGEGCEVELLQTKIAGKGNHSSDIHGSAMGQKKTEEEDVMGSELGYSFKIFKPKTDVPKPMPVIIGTDNTQKFLVTDSLDGLGHAVVIWKGKNKVPKQYIGECKWNHSLVKHFGNILDAIEADPDFDNNRIVVAGFSGTAKAALLFGCYADRLMGMYISGAGPGIVSNPGCGLSVEGACNSVVYKQNDVKPYKGQCEECKWKTLTNCKVTKNCETKGMYPCYVNKPFAVVAQTGERDYQRYIVELLYSASLREGFDSRFQLWDFGHNRPKELSAVIMGTFGLGDYCPWSCHEAVQKCAESATWKNLNWCLAWPNKHRPSECPKFCIPTKGMLKFSVDRFIEHKGTYGSVEHKPRGAESKCSVDDFKK